MRMEISKKKVVIVAVFVVFLLTTFVSGAKSKDVLPESNYNFGVTYILNEIDSMNVLGFCVDSNGNLFVLRKGLENMIVDVISSKAEHLLEFEVPGKQISSSYSIRVNENGQILVFPTARSKAEVFVFSSKGELKYRKKYLCKSGFDVEVFENVNYGSNEVRSNITNEILLSPVNDNQPVTFSREKKEVYYEGVDAIIFDKNSIQYSLPKNIGGFHFGKILSLVANGDIIAYYLSVEPTGLSEKDFKMETRSIRFDKNSNIVGVSFDGPGFIDDKTGDLFSVYIGQELKVSIIQKKYNK